MNSVIQEIAAERERQISEKGWSHAHDDEHVNGELAGAAAVYAGWNSHIPDYYFQARGALGSLWPFESIEFNPKSPRADLVRAAALNVAEIERLDRAAARAAD